MTNLDRLKGTTYLIDGFESCLKNWLAPMEPNPDPLHWTDEEMELVRSMPDSALQFYEVVQRWPTSWIVEINELEQDALLFPPLKVTERWIPNSNDKVAIDFSRVSIAAENQDNWTVEVSLEKEDFGKLYVNVDKELYSAKTLEWFPMETSLDEFLVMFGFYNMIICSGYFEHETERFPDSELIFTGGYASDLEHGVFYHPDGLLWLTTGPSKEDGIFWCAKKPST